MPADFINRVRSCNDPRVESSANLIKDANIPTFPCLIENSELGDKQSDLAYTSVKYVATGEDAQKAYDAMQQQTKYKLEKLQDAGRGMPEVVMGYQNEHDTGPDWAVWYPDKKVLVTSPMASNYRGREAEVMKFFGFMK